MKTNQDHILVIHPTDNNKLIKTKNHKNPAKATTPGFPIGSCVHLCVSRLRYLNDAAEILTY